MGTMEDQQERADGAARGLVEGPAAAAHTRREQHRDRAVGERPEEPFSGPDRAQGRPRAGGGSSDTSIRFALPQRRSSEENSRVCGENTWTMKVKKSIRIHSARA